MSESLSLLYRVDKKIRRTMNQSAENDLYSRTVISQEYLPTALQRVWESIRLDSGDRVRLWHSITTNSETEYYQLPRFRRIYSMVQRETAFGSVTARVSPVSPTSDRTHGWTIEGGGTLRVRRGTFPKGDWEIEYEPDGEAYPHYGTGSLSEDADSVRNVFALAASPTLGLLDRRLGAYVGWILRVFPSSGPVEERLIVSHTHNAGTFSVTTRTPFTDTATGSVTYEVVPAYSPAFEDVVASDIALQVATNEGYSRNRLQQLMLAYKRSLKAVIDKLSNVNGSTGIIYNKDTPWNREPFYGSPFSG